MISQSQRRRTISRLLLTFGLAVVSIIMVLPFAWTVSSSFKATRDVFAFPIEWIPSNPTVEAYERALGLGSNQTTRRDASFFPRSYLNSVLVAVPGVVVPLVTSTLAAYAFARLRFPWRNQLFFLYLVTMIVPIQVLLIPRFAIVHSLGIYNTLWALIVPYFTVAYGTFLLRQAFMVIPQELIDAAKIDGAGHLGIIRHVIVPASLPNLAALAMLLFIWRWNDYASPLIMVTDRDNYTIPIALASFVNDAGEARWEVIMAATVLATLPLILVYMLANRFFVQSMVHTGVKG